MPYGKIVRNVYQEIERIIDDYIMDTSDDNKTILETLDDIHNMINEYRNGIFSGS